MAERTLSDALHDELRDLLSCEKQLTKALPKLAKKASNEQLKQAFEQHAEQTRSQQERVEECLKQLGKSARGKKCEGIEGIIEEGEEAMDRKAQPDVMDAMLIAQAQKAEHYEIASYGTAATWAKQAGHEEMAGVLHQILQEEEETDRKLTELAKSIINPEAARPEAA